MRREYSSGGKRRTVEDVPNVLAVRLKPGLHEFSTEQTKTLGRRVTSKPPGIEAKLNLPDDQTEAFERQGWLLIEPTEILKQALAQRELPSDIQDVQPVYRKASGVIVLGTRQITLKVRPDLGKEDVEKLMRERGVELVLPLQFGPNLFLVRVGDARQALDAVAELEADPRVVYAEPVFVEHLPGRFRPSDPDYNLQWQWQNTGAEAAWDRTRGAGVRIAVVDNGFDVRHEDLVDAIAASSGYFAEVDPTIVGDEIFRRTLEGFPSGNHGTLCAGIAGARHSNGTGGCGGAPESELLLVSCLDDQVGSQVTLARAIAYAANPTTEVPGANPAAGADVISCSLGPNGADWELASVLKDAIDYAVTSGRGGLGTAVFWAVSNGSNVAISRDEVSSLPTTIAVGRSRADDTEDGAARGPELDFLAPGVNVYSTQQNGRYGTVTGTSFAAPCACAIGALVLSVRPDLSWQQLRELMRMTCDKTGGAVYDTTGRNDDYGFGRVNCGRAIETALQGDPREPEPVPVPGPRPSLLWLYTLLLDESSSTAAVPYASYRGTRALSTRGMPGIGDG